MKLSVVNSQVSSGSVVKDEDVRSGSPWFECWLVCFDSFCATLVIALLEYLNPVTLRLFSSVVNWYCIVKNFGE